MRPVPIAMKVRNAGVVAVETAAPPSSTEFTSAWTAFTPSIVNFLDAFGNPGAVQPSIATKYGAYILLGDFVIIRYIVYFNPTTDSAGSGDVTGLALPPGIVMAVSTGTEGGGVEQDQFFTGYGNLDYYYPASFDPGPDSTYIKPLGVVEGYVTPVSYAGADSFYGAGMWGDVATQTRLDMTVFIDAADITTGGGGGPGPGGGGPGPGGGGPGPGGGTGTGTIALRTWGTTTGWLGLYINDPSGIWGSGPQTVPVYYDLATFGGTPVPVGTTMILTAFATASNRATYPPGFPPPARQTPGVVYSDPPGWIRGGASTVNIPTEDVDANWTWWHKVADGSESLLVNLVIENDAFSSGNASLMLIANGSFNPANATMFIGDTLTLSSTVRTPTGTQAGTNGVFVGFTQNWHAGSQTNSLNSPAVDVTRTTDVIADWVKGCTYGPTAGGGNLVGANNFIQWYTFPITTAPPGGATDMDIHMQAATNSYFAYMTFWIDQVV